MLNLHWVRHLPAIALFIAMPLQAQVLAPETHDSSVPPASTTPQVDTPAPVTPPPVVTPPPADTPPPPPVKKGPPDALKPGQYIWEARGSYANPLRMVVVLDIQRMYVFDGDELVGFTTISSGKKGKETPTGAFKILQKKIYHESNIYANAPMPFMQRLTWDGIALHAGHNPGYPASHGCIRLPKAFAKSLYDATSMEGDVVILASLTRPKPKPQPVPQPEPEKPVEPAVEPVVPAAEPLPAPTPR